MCRGPHVVSTSVLKNFKLLSVSAAYWRGDSKNEQLQRVYGTCFPTEEGLKEHLLILEERKKRDHRKLGKELELFMLSEYGPGLPFWLPKGYTLRRTLEDFWLDLHRKRGYLTINTPIMLNRELWETSGHWDHYKDDMFTIDVEEGKTYEYKYKVTSDMSDWSTGSFNQDGGESNSYTSFLYFSSMNYIYSLNLPEGMVKYAPGNGITFIPNEDFISLTA